MILELTAEAQGALSANPYFSNVPVLALDEKDIGARVEEAMNKLGTSAAGSSGGAAVVLGTSRLGKPKADVQGAGSLYFDEVIFHATVFENVPLNRGTGGTGKKASAIAEMVAVVLHWHLPAGVSECLICIQGPTVVPTDNPASLVYDVAFLTQGGISANPAIAYAATPGFTVHDNGNGTSTVTVTCTTPYAQVWYTVDGTAPSPLDATNTPRAPYTAPFVVTNGSTKLQARAWLAGYLPSAVSKANI